MEEHDSILLSKKIKSPVFHSCITINIWCTCKTNKNVEKNNLGSSQTPHVRLETVSFSGGVNFWAAVFSDRSSG